MAVPAPAPARRRAPMNELSVAAAVEGISLTSRGSHEPQAPARNTSGRWQCTRCARPRVGQGTTASDVVKGEGICTVPVQASTRVPAAVWTFEEVRALYPVPPAPRAAHIPHLQSTRAASRHRAQPRPPPPLLILWFGRAKRWTVFGHVPKSGCACLVGFKHPG